MSLSPSPGDASSSLPSPPAFLDDVEVPSSSPATTDSAVSAGADVPATPAGPAKGSGETVDPPPSLNNITSSNTSFTADSPYYSFYVDQEIRSLQVLTETLRDIAARAATFGKCGALMAEATRRLAMSCKLKGSNLTSGITEEEMELQQKQQLSLEEERQKAVGDEMGAVLKVLGDALEEIADAQLQMCESLQVSLSTSLNQFSNTEFSQVQNMKAEADSMTETAEQSYGKYLHGRHAASENETVNIDQDMVSSSWNKIGEQVGHHWMRWSYATGGDTSSSTSSAGDRLVGFKSWTRSTSSGENSAASNSIAHRGRRKQHQQLHQQLPTSTDDVATATSWAMASSAANLRLTLEQIRLSQATAEMKRFLLLQKLVSIQHRRNFELGESVLASLHGIRAYFHHCSDLVSGLVPRMNRIQSSQAESRSRHETLLAPWNDRERGMSLTVADLVDSTNQASNLVNGISQVQQPNPDTPPPPAAIMDQILSLQQQPMSLKEIEQLSHFWDLPMLLAESSSYHREPTPGVIIEGWLYKKSNSRVTLNPWSRRWFMMNTEGLYYFRTNSERASKKQQHQQQPGAGDMGAYWNALERVKVCDVILCTVREVRNDGLPRFCFEVFTPNQKALLLQARGPHDYKMWVQGIRSTAEQQLVHGNHSVTQPPLYQHDNKKRNNKSKQDYYSSGEAGFDFQSRPARPSSANSDNDTDDDRQLRGGSNHRKDYDDDDDDDETDGEAFHIVSAERDLLGRRQQQQPHGRGNPAVELILQANPVCADCGTVCPDWASLNLGVLVCIECSGVHRSLGVHVSKVRSLMLDALTESEGLLLLALGNASANQIWEESVGSQKGWTKPSSSATRKLKEEWIKSKYSWKGFLKYCDSDGKTVTEREVKFSKDLYEAAKRADVVAAAYAIAHGGSVEWKNPDEGGKTPLHVCALSKVNESVSTDWKGIECAELLLQNGAKLDVLDHKTQTVLDCALTENACHEMIDFLSLRGA